MFLIDRRYFRYFDWISCSLIALLNVIGLLFVFSATYKPDVPYSLYFKKQLFGIISGFAIYFILSTFDFRSFARWGYFIYFFILALLAFTLIKGSIGMGAQRWVSLGFIKFQPSEVAKLFLPAFLAYYFQTQETDKVTLQDCIPVFGVLGLSFILILKQPDLGTALIITFSGLLLIWIAGLNKKYFILGLIFILFTAPLSWHCLKSYQKQRILVFLGYGDSQKEGYQIEQSKIAIGSGGMLGKGFKQGTQNRLLFLPANQTDFIYAVICEEWGFMGSILILMIFCILFLRILLMISSLDDPYYQLLGIGLIIHLIFSMIINIGMVIGLLPIVGIPLPFISYGVSHLWISFASMGWLNSIAIRRYYTGIAEKKFNF